jgi:prepilin-type N-terminal cleavage/methylation domain-containing protein
MRSKKIRGFSLIEMMIVLVVILIAVAVGTISIKSLTNQSHVNNAYTIVIEAMRTAREQAIATRRVYMVSFNTTTSPETVTITQSDNGTVMATYPLPTDTLFTVQSNFPNVGPDGFGTGAVALDLDQGVATASASDKSTIYFYPDGSGQDVRQNTNNGVIYVGRANDTSTPRAITVWGATGRLRGWRLYGSGSLYWGQI